MLENEYFVAKRGHYLYKVLPGVFLFVIITFIGMSGNLNIIWASIRKKQLRSKCNILIAILAISDVLHQSGHFFLFYLLFSTQNFSTGGVCFWMELPALIGLNMGTFMMLQLGVDRLLCVLCPIKYKQWNPTLYVALQLVLPLTYACWLCSQAYIATQTQPDFPVVCMVPNAYAFWSKKLWATAMLPITAVTVVIYALIWITFYVRNGNMDRKLMHSLTWIMLMVIVGHFFISFSLIYDTYMPNLESEEILAHHMYFGVIINWTISMNYPIYYMNTHEYRAAFQEQLQILFFRPNVKKSQVSIIKHVTSQSQTRSVVDSQHSSFSPLENNYTH